MSQCWENFQIWVSCKRWGKLWTKPRSSWGLFARQRQRVHGDHVDPIAGFQTWYWAVTVCKTKLLIPPPADLSAEEAIRCHQVCNDKYTSRFALEMFTMPCLLVLHWFLTPFYLLWVMSESEQTGQAVTRDALPDMCCCCLFLLVPALQGWSVWEEQMICPCRLKGRK